MVERTSLIQSIICVIDGKTKAYRLEDLTLEIVCGMVHGLQDVSNEKSPIPLVRSRLR
jgi:hypothetical protein